MATMETFVADKWVALDKGRDLFSKAANSGVPIRVVHPNGNFKVIRNGDKLPEAEATTSTKPEAVEAKLEAAHKRANKIIEKAMTIDPAMVGA
tara:strand:- start:231 stop:509 length:279 start_codon:yes stop_codon:yes gene_type:complete